jgi:hypothetical protein
MNLDNKKSALHADRGDHTLTVDLVRSCARVESSCEYLRDMVAKLAIAKQSKKLETEGKRESEGFSDYGIRHMKTSELEL